MNPHQKPRPLFFTPRSPWGRLPLKRAHQSHMRASEGEKLDPASKNAQGLGGAMAQNQLGGQPTQAGSAGNDVWKTPTYVPPPPLKAANPADMLKEKLPQPKDHALDRNIPQGLTGQTPAPESGGPVPKTPPFVLPTPQSPQPATGSGVLIRPPTQEEKMNEQIKRSGGAQNSIQKPEPKSWLEKLPVKPSFDFHKRRLEGFELEKEVPWDQIFGK